MQVRGCDQMGVALQTGVYTCACRKVAMAVIAEIHTVVGVDCCPFVYNVSHGL